jgi:hypothetical protein
MLGAIEKQQLDDIATWMVVIEETDLPDILKGVFFMDGNPLPDYCITFYNLKWETQTQSLALPVYGPFQWSFHSSFPGWLLLRGAQVARFTYLVQFDDATLERAQITPIALGIQIPKWVVNATMQRDETISNGDIWHRKNRWFGGYLRIAEYTLRRVVDGNGQYTPAFKDMLARVDSECLVVSRARSNA